jgi:16S rRNA (cytosine1402-N4)-methyltransferase
MSGNRYHCPVLLKEVMGYFSNIKKGTFIDCTIGGGGHAKALLSEKPNIHLIGIDKDPAAITCAENVLKGYKDRMTLVQAGFEELPEIAKSLGVKFAAGILADLGLSSRQVDDPARGFSFSKEGPLDMRFSPGRGITAAHIVNSYTEKQLNEIIRLYGEERRASGIARAIVGARQRSQITTTRDLARIVDSVCTSSIKSRARVFQAVRIEVNQELKVLGKALQSIPLLLEKGGRFAVISYHSLEDRLVKRVFRDLSQPMERGRGLQRINKKVTRPGRDEVQENPRARSARMRVIERQ